MARFARHFAPCRFSAMALFPCYGMAEATLFVSARPGIHMENRGEGHCDVSIGVTGGKHNDPAVRVVSPETGLECPEGEEGEIWVKSRSVACGYHRESALSAQVFNGRLGDETGFLRTGDLGYLSDQNLYFTGSLKNLIKRRGRSFHAEDIEGEARALLRDAGIARSAAFVLETQDGAVLVLLLELDGRQDAEKVAAHLPELQARLWDSPGILVARIKLVRPLALPLTTSGKLQRGVCRERFLAGGFAHV
jgi:acyl-CoA synthetase (AMP-forming)/AMP-acid ligase II